jgi:ribonuclease HII
MAQAARSAASKVQAAGWSVQASMLAMQRAISQLKIRPDFIKVDGNRLPELDTPAEAIVQGDSLVAEISAASIIAKVARDEEMQILDRLYPGYYFSIHKAYPTQLHQQALQQLGISPQHRTSFAPVKKLIS